MISEYLILLTLKVDGYTPYVQLGKIYNLSFTPLKNDIIVIDEYFCTVDERCVWIEQFEDGSDATNFHLHLTANSPQHVVENENEAIERLRDDVEEMKSFEWYVNDCSKGLLIDK